jgi:hypothetical protein
MNLVTPKVGAKHKHLLNKPASAPKAVAKHELFVQQIGLCLFLRVKPKISSFKIGF